VLVFLKGMSGLFFDMSDFINLKYLGTVLICEDCINEEIKST